MKFMISFTHTRGEMADRIPRWESLSPDERQGVGNHVKDLAAALAEEQDTKMVFFGPPEEARTLRLDRDGSIDVTDGPLVDGDEFVGGYFIIEADSMDQALEWARRGRWLVGSNEVREIKDLKF
jgi:hypothetical protein